MDVKLLFISLGIILGNLAIVKLVAVPYMTSMLLFTILPIILWFLFLRKYLPLQLKRIDTKIRNNTLAIILIPLLASAVTLLVVPSVDFGLITYLVAISLLIAISEEVLFRFIALDSLLVAGGSPKQAIVFSSLLFTFGHILLASAYSLDSILVIINTFTMGLVLGYVYFMTRNILYVMGIHFVWDITNFINQRVATEDVALPVTVTLLALQIWYVVWAVRGMRRL